MIFGERLSEFAKHWSRGILVALLICAALSGGAAAGILIVGIGASLAKTFWAISHSDAYFMKVGMVIGVMLLTPYFLSRLEEEGSLDPDRWIKR